MRLGLIVLFVALLLAAIAGQNSLLQSTEARDSTSGTLVLDHRVFRGGCGSVDLHVVRYVLADSASGESVVAQWCS